MNRLTSLVAACALALVVSACGGDTDSSGKREPYAPTGTPTLKVAMMKPPADYTSIEGEGFTISAPGEFQQQHKESSNGEPMLILEKPSGIPALPQRVAIIRDVDPKSPAVEQSFALETAKAAAGPGGEVERIAMPAPEGQSAFLVSWKEARPSQGAENVDVRYWQLMYEVSSDLILNVVAFAPADEFETSEVSKILRTFVPESA